MNNKFLGAVIALAIALVILFLLLIVLALFGVRETTLVGLSSAFGAPVVGLLVVGWRCPEMFVTPVHSAWCRVNERRAIPAQRFLFLLSALADYSWLATRVVGGV
jgi:hypothetical protein